MQRKNQETKKIICSGSKGQIIDVTTILIAVAVLSIGLIIAVTLFSNFKGAMNELNITGVSEANATMTQFEAGFTTLDKTILPLMVIGLIIGLIVTSLFIPSHPAFIVINIIGMLILVFMGVAFRYLYDTIASVDIIASSTQSLVFTPIVMKTLPWIGFIAILIATVIGMGKRSDF